MEWLLEGYPDITREDVAAALAYASDAVLTARAPVVAAE